MTTFGEVTWESPQGAKKENNKDLWLRLDSGSNELRIITQPFQYLSHKYKKNPTDKGFGQKVYCSGPHGSCPVCKIVEENPERKDAKELKAKRRWLLGVISRKTGQYKILDISYQVFSQIQKLAANHQRWGDPQKYDIDIIVDKNGGATGFYSVQPLPKEPLSAEDQRIKDNVDLDDLKKRVTPPTPDQVQKRLDKLNGDAVGSSPTASKGTPAVSLDDDEDNTDFPAYKESNED